VKKGSPPPPSLLNTKKFHIEDQRGVGWNDSWITLGPISIVGTAGELGSLPDTHLSNTLIPSLDDLSLSQLELEWGSPVPGGVKLLAIGQGPRVVDNNCLARLGEGASIPLLNGVNCNAHDGFRRREVSSWKRRRG